MRIVFMGTAPLARVCLEALASSGDFTITAVVTQPDKPQGRELRLLPSPVKEAALRLGLPVLQPVKAREPGFVESLARLSPDLIVVAAYGQILPQAILDIPRLGCVNVHASLLPKYRGAAPIQRAILNGEPITGVTIMKMDAGLDTGAMLSEAATPITGEDNSETLGARLATMGAALLLETIPRIAAGEIHPRPQPAEGASYAAKIAKEEGLIRWDQPARQIWGQIRAFSPRPGAFTRATIHGQARLLKIWRAGIVPEARGVPGSALQSGKEGLVIACGQDALRIEELQSEGGKKLQTREFLAGHPFPVGSKFE
jgi:methionyl-tRNA formyltransferase